MNKLLTTPNEWQHIDKEKGMLYPWYTETFLFFRLRHLRFPMDAKVLELGAGASTLWWASQCDDVFSVEDDEKWYKIVKEGIIASLIGNVTLQYSSNMLSYIQAIDNRPNDVIIVDGSHRAEILQYLKPKHFRNSAGYLIVDNVEQIDDFLDFDIIRNSVVEIYPQPNHYCWRTALVRVEPYKVVGNNHEENSHAQKVRRLMTT